MRKDSPGENRPRPDGDPSLGGNYPVDVGSLREKLKAIPDPLEFLANLFAASPVGFAIADPQGHCFLVNQAFMDMFTVAPPPQYSILQDDILESLGLMPYVRRAFAGEAVQTPVFWYDPRDLKSIHMRAGKRVAFSMNLIPLFSRDGKLEFVAMTYKDETEVSLARLNLEAKVAERTRDMETFIGSVSHDLRAPMRSIGGFAQVLLQDHAASLDPEGRGHLQRIADAARRMEVLVDGLLSFFRLGQKAVDVSDVSTEQLVRQALEDLSAERVPHTMELVMGELPSCRADPVLLRQVFVNLINNALKFSGRRPVPRVEVGSRLEGDERVWFVRDNGAGFDMGLKDRLFGMFQRLHPMSDFEGNGIGLALVRRIVEKHGGRVWAQSAPGEGATFYFTLKT